jgi:hypothetical protein
LKAAASIGTLSGSALADYRAISNGFVQSLVNAGAFDTMLAAMVPLPLGTGTVGAVSTGIQAATVLEGQMKPISRLTITRALEVIKNASSGGMRSFVGSAGLDGMKKGPQRCAAQTVSTYSGIKGPQ